MLFGDIPRVRLLSGITPLSQMKNAGALLGKDALYIKRDDIMELGMAGNKLRSLEFWLGEAIAVGADVIIAAGLPTSNQCRLTAAACAKLGLECVIIHNSEPPESDVYTGNPLLNHLMGAKIIYCGNVDEYKRADFAAAHAEALRSEGRKPYIANDPVVGALGYVNAALELAAQAERENIDLRDIFISASGGPTEIGLLFGLAMFGNSFRLHIVSVEYKREVFSKISETIYAGLCEKLGFTPPGNPKVISTFYDDYLGTGYAVPTAECIEASRFLARNEGIFIETTYNSKVFAGMMDLIKKGRADKGAACYYHTGGAPALYTQGEYFANI